MRYGMKPCLRGMNWPLGSSRYEENFSKKPSYIET